MENLFSFQFKGSRCIWVYFDNSICLVLLLSLQLDPFCRILLKGIFGTFEVSMNLNTAPSVCFWYTVRVIYVCL